MMLQRIIAFLMTAIAAATLGIMSQEYTYSAVIILVSLLGLPGRLKWNLMGKQRTFFLLIMSAAFALKHRLAPFENDDINGFLMFSFAYAVGQYLLAAMAIHFYWPHKIKLPAELVLAGLVVVMAAGDVSAEGNVAKTYQLLVIAFLATAAVYSISLRRPAEHSPTRRGLVRLVVIILILGGAVGLGGLFSSKLYDNQRDAYFLLQQINLFGRAKKGVGFNSSARLDSISKMKQSDSSSPALRIFSDDPPGYMRAKVFDTYANSRWSSLPGNTRNVLPSPSSEISADILALPASGGTFVIIPSAQQPWRVMNVWPAPEITQGMFAPLGTAIVRAPVDSVQTDYNQTVDSGIRGGLNYAIAQPVTPPSEKLLAKARIKYLQLPRKLDKQIAGLAKNIFADCKTPAHKFAMVRKYFADNYTYELGIQVPKGQEPLNYFLLEKPAAHCEFFASGAAILLRFADVPTRYVTGFVAEERSPFGGYWMARHKDAHAWVEAWDDDLQQWVIVEATPASGVPGGGTQSKIGYLWDYINFRFQELRVAIYFDGLKGLAIWLWHRFVGLAVVLVSTWQGLVVLAVLIIFIVYRRVRHSHRKALARPCSKTVLAMNALLNRVDAKLRKQKIIRTLAETLDQFATRIEEKSASEELAATVDLTALAEWYRHYSLLRYRGEVTEEDFRQLEESLPR